MASELEIDERLYLGALHLNDDEDDGSYQQGCQQDATPLDDCDTGLRPSVGHEMGDIAKENHGEDCPVALHHL